MISRREQELIAEHEAAQLPQHRTVWDSHGGDHIAPEIPVGRRRVDRLRVRQLVGRSRPSVNAVKMRVNVAKRVL